MSTKVLIVSVAVLLAVGGVAAYVWVDYSRAQNSLTRSRLEVRSLGENLERHPEDVARLKEMCQSAKFQVDTLEKFHSGWIDKGEISAMRTTLEKDQHDIDELAAAADKQKSSGASEGWVHPSRR